MPWVRRRVAVREAMVVDGELLGLQKEEGGEGW